MIPRRGQSSHSHVYRGRRVPMWTRRESQKLEDVVRVNGKGKEGPDSHARVSQAHPAFAGPRHIRPIDKL